MFSSFESYFMQECETFSGPSVLKVRIFCFSLWLMRVNQEFLGFGQKKELEVGIDRFLSWPVIGADKEECFPTHGSVVRPQHNLI